MKRTASFILFEILIHYVKHHTSYNTIIHLHTHVPRITLQFCDAAFQTDFFISSQWLNFTPSLSCPHPHTRAQRSDDKRCWQLNGLLWLVMGGCKRYHLSLRTASGPYSSFHDSELLLCGFLLTDTQLPSDQ